MSFAVNCYISCGCNRTQHGADWGDENKICFAAGSDVAIFQTSTEENTSKIFTTIPCHSAPVTSVRWIRDELGRALNVFISTSVDKTSVVIDYSGELNKVVLSGHQNTVSIADGIVKNPRDKTDISSLVAATASVDSCIRIWNIKNGESECRDCIIVGSGFALDVRLAYLEDSVILACATDDRKIGIFAENLEKRFTKVHSLTGHEDWVRSLDFCWHGQTLLLASGSQDSFVRVHQFKVKGTEPVRSTGFIIETEEAEFMVGGRRIGVRLDTVLSGHENWVYGVCFNKGDGKLKLLTSSMDKTLVIWNLEEDLWIETARVGEVGGNSLGFYGGKFSPTGDSVLAHGYQGSFHLWRNIKEDCWEPGVVVGGHVGDITDLSWSPSGRYLLSVGTDQTTRLHAPWQQKNQIEWHEIARPQVHGHDMSCIATISDTSFVSGAEEKVLRAFQAPANFLQNFRQICKVDVSEVKQGNLPQGAAVPALGLSNKPVFNDSNIPDPDLYFSPLNTDRPPTEENLMQNTLWPETQKLYGHGYEVHCVAASPDGLYVASACHATSPEHAAVIIWDTKAWGQLQKLIYHRLTVTQMEFCPNNGRHLVTVSRDRRWCLYRKDENSGLFEIYKSAEKSPHTRIIWCCAWANDGRIFVTGSRDGVICVWDAESGACLTQNQAGHSVTALAFSHIKPDYLLAGTDSGKIQLYSIINGIVQKIREFQHHSGTVRRIRFKPSSDKNIFASCSRILKVFELTQT